MQQAIEDLLRNPAVWRVGQVPHNAHGSIPTAYPALDQILPERGWPLGALTELLVTETGAGELSLLTPALQAVCAKAQGVVLAGPPFLPHARAWEAVGIELDRMLVIDADGADLLWSAEQALRSGECGAAVLWAQRAGKTLDHRALQRLHLAASKGNAACLLFRPASAQSTPSPAPLRVTLKAHAGQLQVQVIKCRGALRVTPGTVDVFPPHWSERYEPAPAADPLETTALRLIARARTFLA